MLIYFTCLQAFAYFPTALFGNFPNCLEDALNMQQGHNARQTGSMTGKQAYCTALLAILLAVWPLLAFVFFMKQGFNPYEELSKEEMAVKGGSFAPLLAAGRTFCHYFLIILTVYLIALWVMIILIRNIQRNGNKVWMALKIRAMPFGSLYFQEGLYFDCGICL